MNLLSLKRTLREALFAIQIDIKDIGPCDHEANICVEGLQDLESDLEHWIHQIDLEIIKRKGPP